MPINLGHLFKKINASGLSHESPKVIFNLTVDYTLTVSRVLEGLGNRLSDLHDSNIGIVTVQETWRILEEDAKSQLIDVRSRAEWAFVGGPDLTSICKMPILIEWQHFPNMELNEQFATILDEELKTKGVDKTAKLFFMCRSGVRSLSAAQAMAAIGYSDCHNVADGFEGPLDELNHRGKVSGWKANKLPWSQR